MTLRSLAVELSSESGFSDHAGSVQQPQWNGTMAKEYPFKLDPFQSTSVACLVSTFLVRPLSPQDPLKSLIQLWLNLHFDKSAGAKGVCTGGSTHVSWQNSCSRVSVIPKALAAQPCIATVQHKVSTHVSIYYLILL